MWKESDSAQTLLQKVRKVKYMLKRVEFGLDSVEALSEWVNQDYSPYAIDTVLKEYSFR